MAVAFHDFSDASDPGDDLSGWTDAAVADAVSERRAALEQAERAWLAAVAEADRRGVAAASGAPSTAAWLRQRCRLRGSTASSAVRTARQLGRLPRLDAAWSEGRVTSDHVFLITRVTHHADDDEVARVEPIVVAQAARCRPDDLRPTLRHWRDLLDDAPADDGPDAPGDPTDGASSPSDDERAAESLDARAYRHRKLTLAGGLDGTGFLDGELSPDGYRIARTVLERFMDIERSADADAPLDARRTNAQLRHDALVAALEAAQSWLDRGKGHLARPSTLIVRDVAAARCEADGDPVSPRTADRHWCDSDVAVLRRNGNEILDLGRSVRLASPTQRRALIVRDGGCRFAGCDRPHRWCIAHHVTPWDHGGSTDLDNLVLLCRHHHTLVHQGWAIIRGPDGDWVTRRPDGTTAGRQPPPTTGGTTGGTAPLR